MIYLKKKRCTIQIRNCYRKQTGILVLSSCKETDKLLDLVLIDAFTNFFRVFWHSTEDWLPCTLLIWNDYSTGLQTHVPLCARHKEWSHKNLKKPLENRFSELPRLQNMMQLLCWDFSAIGKNSFRKSRMKMVHDMHDEIKAKSSNYFPISSGALTIAMLCYGMMFIANDLKQFTKVHFWRNCTCRLHNGAFWRCSKASFVRLLIRCMYRQFPKLDPNLAKYWTIVISASTDALSCINTIFRFSVIFFSCGLQLWSMPVERVIFLPSAILHV